MIGTRLRHALALTLVPVFAVGLLGGAYGLHGCPRHDATGHAERGAPADAPRGGTTSGVRPAASPTVAVLSAPDGDEGGAGSPSCICIGSCHAGAAATHPVSPSLRLPPSPPAVATAGLRARAVPPHRTPAYFLPYPLGPPPT